MEKAVDDCEAVIGGEELGDDGNVVPRKDELKDCDESIAGLDRLSSILPLPRFFVFQETLFGAKEEARRTGYF